MQRFGGDKNYGCYREEGALLTETTTRYYKWGAQNLRFWKSITIPVEPALKVIWGRSRAETREWTKWSEDPLGCKKNEWYQHSALFSGI